MKCLKTGFCLKINEKYAINCDLYGNLTNEEIFITDSARNLTKHNNIFDASLNFGSLIPSENFKNFMSIWNPEFEGWENWKIKIDIDFRKGFL